MSNKAQKTENRLNLSHKGANDDGQMLFYGDVLYK